MINAASVRNTINPKGRDEERMSATKKIIAHEEV